MQEPLFSIACPTCQRMLGVRDEAVIGAILACPKCGSMVQIVPPKDWQPKPKPLEPAPSATPQPSSTSTEPVKAANESTNPTPKQAAKPGAKRLPVARAFPAVERPKPAARPPVVPSAAPPIPQLASTAEEPSEPAAVPPPVPVAAPWRGMLLAIVPVLGVAIAVGVWAINTTRVYTESPEETAAENAGDAAEASQPSVATVPGDPVPQRLARRWLPRNARLIVSLRLSQGAGEGTVERAIREAEPFWQPSIGSVMETFGLQLRCVRRLTWSSCDLAAWRDQAVVLIELAEDQNAGSFRTLGQPVDLQVGQVQCRRMPQARWSYPYAILDDRTILTGRAELLRELADRTDGRLESRPIEQLLKSTTAETHFVLLDLAAARDAGWRMPSTLLDVWPAGRDSWRLITQLPHQGIGLIVRGPKQSHSELALLCDGESAADKVLTAVKQLLPAAGTALESQAASLTKKLQAGRITTEKAEQYEILLKEGKAALQVARCEIAADAVWVRIDWQDKLPAIASAALNSPAAIQADWLEAGQAVDDGNHRRLATALSGYVKAEGHYPAGAGGGMLLPPSTRLSWIATMLPYFEHRDWRRELQFGYSWNSTQNRPVTQRSLEAVVNPVILERATEAGFPVTHYVGVAGVGADAGDLKASDPRAGVFGFSRMTRPEEIPDGASNTIAILGAAKRLGPWGAGGDATVRAFTQRPYVNGPDGFGSGQPNGMLAGMADGAVRFVSKDVDPTVLEQLATINGRKNASVAVLEVKPSPASPAEKPEAEAKPKAAAKPEPETVAAEKPGKRMPAKPSEEEEEPSDEAETPKEVDVEARLVDTIPEIELTDVPLVNALRLLGQMSHAPVTFDLDAMAEVGAGLRDPVKVKLSDTKMGDILTAILSSRKLTCAVENGQILVTNAQKRTGVLRAEKYPAADLAGQSPAAMAEFAGWIRKLVAPETWRQAGGQGTIEVVGQSLAVQQTEAVQYQIKTFCQKLRAAREKQADRGGRLILATHFDLARVKLRQPVTSNFPDPTPLGRILRDLEEASQATIVADGLTLQASGVTPDAKATLRVHDQPLSEALVELLAPLGLTYRIVGADVFEVTTRKAAAARMEVEFYPIGETLAKNQTADAIVERIKGQVSPATWSDAGGPGVMYFDKPSGYLVVLQSQPLQVKTQILLSKLASELGAAPVPTTREPAGAHRR